MPLIVDAVDSSLERRVLAALTAILAQIVLAGTDSFMLVFIAGAKSGAQMKPCGLEALDVPAKC